MRSTYVFLLLVACSPLETAEEQCGRALVSTYMDADGDGFGADDSVKQTCGVPEGRSLLLGDCNDASADARPGAAEVCDAIDNDCDGLIDDADPTVHPQSFADWYEDGDGDGYAGGASTRSCSAPLGGSWSADDLDCNDQDPAINPGADEVCDNNMTDEDCDGLADDDDSSVDPASFTTFFEDLDDDGYGGPGYAMACHAGMGRALAPDDCDDNDPYATIVTDWYTDADGDGIGDGVSLGYACNPPVPGAAHAELGIDCDDTDATAYPGGVEICGDGIDQDCDGTDKSCGPVGNFNVDEGPDWTTNPQTYTCLEACAMLFGGADTDYQCSTSPSFVDNLAFSSSWGVGGCAQIAEDFKLNTNYNCGAVGCSTSTYVTDNCTGSNTNYCW